MDAVECKWQADRFQADALAAFRRLHPDGNNYLLVPATDSPYALEAGDLSVVVTDLDGWTSGRAGRLASALADGAKR